MSPRTARFVVDTAVVALLAACALPACTRDSRAPSDACRLYTTCFFPDDGEPYQRIAATDEGACYDALAQNADVRTSIPRAYGEGGTCWLSRGNDDEDDTIAAACTARCEAELLAECARRTRGVRACEDAAVQSFCDDDDTKAALQDAGVDALVCPAPGEGEGEGEGEGA